MDKKEKFKSFVASHPQLIASVNNNEMTWQKYYEIYDLFGDDIEKWEPYLDRSPKSSGSGISLSSIGNIIKKVDLNNINKHVNTAQKAVNLFQEFTTKKGASSILPKGPSTLRPINKFFED